MNVFAKVAVGSTLCLTLMACSETTVMNKMGLGKAPPDETQVVANNTLSMPPDLQLPPPSSSTVSESQAPAAGSAVAAMPATPPDAFTAPAAETAAATQVASAETSPYDTGEQQLETYGTSPTAAAQPSPSVQANQKSDLSAANPREDAYRKLGISKTRPDGTPKTQAELDRELLEAVRREKRKQNPKYGTVFNMGELFKGD